MEGEHERSSRLDTRTISLTVNGEAVNRKGQHSIRVNDQYRVCFVWTDNGPDQVEIVDYH